MIMELQQPRAVTTEYLPLSLPLNHLTRANLERVTSLTLDLEAIHDEPNMFPKLKLLLNIWKKGEIYGMDGEKIDWTVLTV